MFEKRLKGTMLKPAENLRQLFVWKRCCHEGKRDVMQRQCVLIPEDLSVNELVWGPDRDKLICRCLKGIKFLTVSERICPGRSGPSASLQDISCEQLFVCSVFYRHNSECTEALQESSSETAVLLLYQEMQRGAEESAGPADGLRHY